MGKSFRLSARPRTIGTSLRGKPFEFGRNISRFVWKRKTMDDCERRPESDYKKSGRAHSPRAASKLQNSANLGRCCWRDSAPNREPLLAQTKAFDNLAIPIRVTTVEIIQ